MHVLLFFFLADSCQNSFFVLLVDRAGKSNTRIPKDVDIDDLIDEINNDIY